MHHRTLAYAHGEDHNAIPAAMSFSFSDTLPSVAWAEPDPATLLHEPSQTRKQSQQLTFAVAGEEWTETVPMGL